LAMRVVGDPSKAEEVTQDVFVAAWRHRAGFDRGRGSLCAWLLTAARNRTIDLARGRVKREIECGLPRDVKSSVNVEETVLKELDQRAISVAVAALPRHQRYAIQQAYFGGQSAREIAREVGVPVSTVKGRLRLGLERLARDVDLRKATGRVDA
ncbi:MAG: sigma-70 family RNA polymerase sigma factor, partial [Candidatus Dormibacteraeota bacterium]|nr:sigma-70 family RNA polymerase sigma factor [Candidatus Dormibacteraeota bacterium]